MKSLPLDGMRFSLSSAIRKTARNAYLYDYQMIKKRANTGNSETSLKKTDVTIKK